MARRIALAALAVWVHAALPERTALGSPGAPTESRAGERIRDAAARVVREFDDAWDRGDIDRLMAAFSPRFGCDMYGHIDLDVLRQVFAQLHEQFPASRCRTNILRMDHFGDTVQTITCRRILDAGGTVAEEMCHVLYLRPEPDEPRIVGLEEFSHAGESCVRAGRYVNEDAAFSFDIPPRTFVVPAPRVGQALDRVVLRSSDLAALIRIQLYRARKDFDTAAAFDHDLSAWMSGESNTRLEYRSRIEVCERAAWLAEVGYRGAGCSLSGEGRDDVARVRTRVYVDVGSPYLMTIDMDEPAGPRRAHEARRAWLQSILDSLRLHPDPNLGFAATVDGNFGFGPVEGARFEAADAGILLEVPGASLHSWRINGQTTVRIDAPERSPIPVFLDAVPLICGSYDIQELANTDDRAYRIRAAAADRAAVIESAPLEVSGVPALCVYRRPVADSAGDSKEPTAKRDDGVAPIRAEIRIYAIHAGCVVTLTVSGDPDDLERARPLLDLTASGVRFVPPR